MSNTVSYIYEILDRYSAPLRFVSRATKHFGKVARQAQQSAQRMSAKMEQIGDRASNLQGALGALGLGAALTHVVNVSSRMEDAMSDIGRVTTGSADDLAQFEKRLEQISEGLGVSKEGLAQMAYEGGRLGVSLGGMEEFLMMTSRTAIAFDMVDQEAGRAIGSIQAKMGLLPADTQKVLDSVNFLADTTSANGAQMIEIIERLSGTFSVLEFPPEVAAAFAGFANQIEVTPELAASGMNMMIRQMRKMPGMTKKLMEDPVRTVVGQLEKMSGMGPELRTRYIEQVFGAEASKFVEKAIGNVSLFGKTLENAMSTEAVGSMQRELEARLERSSTTFDSFRETITNTFDTIGDVIKPFAVSAAQVLMPVVRAVRSFAENNPMVVKFGAALAALIVAFTGVAAAVGVLMAAMAPMVGFLATFAVPVIAITAGVVALAVAFDEWVSSGHPVITMLSEMWNEITAIFEPFGQLFGLVGEAGEGFDGLSWFVEKLGYAVMTALTPLRMLLRSLRGLVEVGSAIMDGDFSGAWDAMKNTGADMFDQFVEGGQALGATLGVDSAQAALEDRQAQRNQTVTGEIAVTAQQGTRVESADIALNGGGNLAYGR